jgi:hypothetical protein
MLVSHFYGLMAGAGLAPVMTIRSATANVCAGERWGVLGGHRDRFAGRGILKFFRGQR